MVEQFGAASRLTRCDPQEAESTERKPRRNNHLQVHLRYVELHLVNPEVPCELEQLGQDKKTTPRHGKLRLTGDLD